MAVGLAQHERDAQRQRSQADGPGDVAAAAEHRAGSERGEQRARRARWPLPASASARSARSGSERLRPATEIGCSGKAGGRHQLGLGARRRR